MTHQVPSDSFSDAKPVIPRGVAHLALAGPVKTREFAFLTLPRFTLLAFSSAVDPLRIANQLTQRPLYRWRVVSLDGAPTESSAGIRVEADQGLQPVGRDTTVIVCSGTDATHAADRKALTWLREHSRHGGSLGAICTGAYTLARAGLLGSDATTVHWENQAAFRELFDIEPLQQIYVMGRRHFSCAGGEAGVDMMLAVIAQDHGPKLADAVAEMCLHSRRREAGTTQKRVFTSPMATRHPDIARVIIFRNSMKLAAELPGVGMGQLHRPAPRRGRGSRPASRHVHRSARLPPSPAFQIGEMQVQHPAALVQQPVVEGGDR
jgi:transcriptional regulator GlxA family with amidase domain